MHIATVLALVAHPVLTRAQITVPDVPASVDLSVVSGESLQLDFTAPLTDGGAAVQSYLVSQLLPIQDVTVALRRPPPSPPTHPPPPPSPLPRPPPPPPPDPPPSPPSLHCL